MKLGLLCALLSLLAGICGSALESTTSGNGRVQSSCSGLRTSSPTLASTRTSVPMTTMMTSC
ncbi:KLK9 isoform 2 [Pongo abelii]|uniref:KLK9 isoform 2 n=1 Tax=Pongo abelii TaxID=9601 RepID=A0A2J8U945_PONAB|nr:KLK9 isoform 2 [Pongo abelii]